MSERMTTFEIYLAICVETVDIWNNPQKAEQLYYADLLDAFNHILQPHAMNNTNLSDEEWARVIDGLSFLVDRGLELDAIVERAEKLAEHPEYFDAELNQMQRLAYDRSWDKRCIEYHTKGQK